MGLGLVLIGALAPSGLFLYLLGPALLTVGLVAGAGNQAIERRARGALYAGPSPYLVFAAIVAATFAATYSIGFVIRLFVDPTRLPDYVVRLLGEAIEAAVFLGVVRLTVVGTGALSWVEMGWRRFDGNAARDLAIGATLALPVIGITSIVAAVLVSIFRTVPEAPLPPTGVAAGLVVQLIAGAILAPIAEEGVFRGFAITAWERTAGPRGALVRAALLFALAHVLNVGGDSLPQVGGLVAVGFLTRLPIAFVLGWLFVTRRSIWAPLGLHAAFNGILLVLAEVVRMNGSALG